MPVRTCSQTLFHNHPNTIESCLSTCFLHPPLRNALGGTRPFASLHIFFPKFRNALNTVKYSIHILFY